MADAVPVASAPIRITLAEPLPGDDVAAEVTSSSPAVAPPQEISAETIAVIETAAAVFLTKHGEDTTAKPHRAAGPDSDSWTHQGRDIVQASHNLVQRGH